MSNVYVYDITVTDIYSEEDFGFISSSPSVSEDYQQISSASATSEDWFVITSTFTQLPFGSIGNISGTAEERSSNKFDASGTIQVSKTLDENVTFTWVGTGTLFEIGNGLERSLSPYVSSGTVRIESEALVAFSANPPEDTQLFSFSGTGIEKDVDSYIGLGTATIYRIPLVHPEVDYTPHYGIDENIGIGTTGIQISGGIDLKSTNSWVGLGTFSALSGAAESITKVYDDYDSIITEYDDWGLLTETLPYNGFFDWGLVSILNDGGEVWGPIVGYGSSTLYPFGLFTISGTVIEKDVDSYIGLGTLTLSETLIEKNTESYVGIGTLILSETLIEKNTESYVGIGTLTLSGSTLESLSANPPEDTQLFSFNGLATQSFDKGPYSGNTIYTLSGVASTREIAVYGYYGDQENPGTSGVITLSANLVHPNIDYTPHYGIEKNIGIGTTGIQISGTGLEAYSAQTPENTQLFTFSGSYSNLQFTVNPPEDTQLFTIGGSLIEKDVDSYSGIGTPTLSGTALEAYSANPPEDTQLFSISGTALKALSAQTPENTQLFSISGELVHPNIDYTPHYGIEKNIGIGTTGIKFLRGVGYTPDSEGNPRDARTYSNRYPINDKVPGTGIGTITFDQTRDLAKYSPLTPYTGTGLFNVVNGFSPQESYPWLPGPGVGKSWSFTRTTYIASGVTTISGIASTREIAVYGYYGNDNNPGTSGTIFISEQTAPIIVLKTDSYLSIGTYFVSGNIKLVQSHSYVGLGSINVSGSTLEVYSAQTPEDFVLYSFSGTALEVYSAQTPEIEVLYAINGTLIERKSNVYDGSGSATLSGSATTRVVPNYPARGLFRFATHTVDNNYDTCDSEEFTCDNQDSANVKFVANPVENTILFNIGGIASTREIATYQNTGIGTYIISGSVSNIKLTHSEVGLGTIFTISSSLEREVDTYVGLGTLLTLSGSAEIYSAQTPESIILLTISGSATTRIESDYPVVGIGLINVIGTASTRKIASYTQIGTGLITLSGQLVYPNIIYIPSPDGSGSISIIGSANDSLTKIYRDTSGSLFEFSSGFESFSRSTYIGLGTIYIQKISGVAINNPFQIPRTYIIII